MGIFWTQKDFFAAIAVGDTRTVNAYLAKNKSWAQSKDKKPGNSALHYAAKSGHAAIVSMLLNAGAPVLTPGEYCKYPIHFAAERGDLDTVRTLLDAGSTPYINSADLLGLSPLLYAIRNDRTEVLKALLETKKADLNAGEKPALYFAVENKRPDCVEILLATGADPNVPRTDIRHDYEDDDDYGFYHRNSSSSGKTVTQYSALNCACGSGHTAIAGMLLRAGAKALPGEFPVQAAAAHGNTELVAELMRFGLNVKGVNSANQTALHAALCNNNSNASPEFVQFLLAQGVNRDAVDNYGRTALSYAQQFALTDIVRVLQNPLPPPAPVPVMPVVPPKPVAVQAPAPAPVPVAAPLPAATATPLTDDDSWILSGKTGVIHATVYPALSRRLTEIFNFETRERIAITENLALKTETMAPHEPFDSITDEALRKAFAEFRRLGGSADEDKVFGNRIMKLKVKP